MLCSAAVAQIMKLIGLIGPGVGMRISTRPVVIVLFWKFEVLFTVRVKRQFGAATVAMVEKEFSN